MLSRQREICVMTYSPFILNDQPEKFASNKWVQSSSQFISPTGVLRCDCKLQKRIIYTYTSILNTYNTYVYVRICICIMNLYINKYINIYIYNIFLCTSNIFLYFVLCGCIRNDYTCWPYQEHWLPPASGGGGRREIERGERGENNYYYSAQNTPITPTVQMTHARTFSGSLQTVQEPSPSCPSSKDRGGNFQSFEPLVRRLQCVQNCRCKYLGVQGGSQLQSKTLCKCCPSSFSVRCISLEDRISELLQEN